MPTHKQKKHILILEGAAGRIADARNTLCCAAICDHCLDENECGQREVGELFAASMEGHDRDKIGRWWGSGYRKVNREARIFALLLVAELVRTDSMP